jgi:hypothetical protein
MTAERTVVVKVNWLNHSVDTWSAKSAPEGRIEAYAECQAIVKHSLVPCVITQRRLENPPQIEYSVRDTVDSMSVNLSVVVCE